MLFWFCVGQGWLCFRRNHQATNAIMPSDHLYGPDDTEKRSLHPSAFSGDSEDKSSHFRLDDKP